VTPGHPPDCLCTPCRYEILLRQNSALTKREYEARKQLHEIIGALRNFKLNGGDAVKQIRAIYADLETCAKELRAAKKAEKSLQSALETSRARVTQMTLRAKKAEEQLRASEALRKNGITN
jgi:chromosome segregation ATPase